MSCAGGASSCTAREPRITHSRTPTSAREATYSAVFTCIHLYQLHPLYPQPSYSRAALKTLHDTVLPPRGWRTQHVGCRYRSGCMTAATTTTAPASSSPA